MKNYEKYADEIKKYKGINFCTEFIKPHIFKNEDSCGGVDCIRCNILQMLWLLEDYEEPEEPKEHEVDWSKVAVDTPILVMDREDGVWIRRHFAKYEGGVVYTWNRGRTSWTEHDVIAWNYAKLTESEKNI